jgi:hypothetical protein
MKQQQTSVAAGGPVAGTASRKAYERPLLQVYGDLTEITQNLMGTGMNDGSGHPNKHFTS